MSEAPLSSAANDEAVATLLSIFDSPWTAETLRDVFVRCGGNLEDAIEAILAHGDGDPDALIERLRSKGDELESPSPDRVGEGPSAEAARSPQQAESVGRKPAEAELSGEKSPPVLKYERGGEKPTVAELQRQSITDLEVDLKRGLAERFLPVAVVGDSSGVKVEKGGESPKIVVTEASDATSATKRKSSAKVKPKTGPFVGRHRIEEPPLPDEESSSPVSRGGAADDAARKSAEFSAEEPAPTTSAGLPSTPEDDVAQPTQQEEPTAIVSDSGDGGAPEDAEVAVVAERIEPGDERRKLRRVRRILAAAVIIFVLVIIGLVVGLTRSKPSEESPSVSSAIAKTESEELYSPEPVTAEPTTCPANESCDRSFSPTATTAVQPTTELVEEEKDGSYPLGGEPYATCGFCHCVPEDSLCPALGAHPEQTPWGLELIDRLSRLDATNPYRLACDPFDEEESCVLYPPQEPSVVELGDNAVCALKYIYSSPEEGEGEGESECPTMYEMVSCESRETAEADGAQLTHWGACGACSTTKDLAAMLTYTTLEDLDMVDRAIKCSLRGEADFDDGVACYSDVGFTEDCAKVWVYSSHNAGKECRERCKNKLSLSGKGPNNGPPPDCTLDDCLRCSLDASGEVFTALSGRTLRRSGLLSEVVWPCGDLLVVDHTLPYCESQAHQPRPAPTEQNASLGPSTRDPSQRPTAEPVTRPTQPPTPGPVTRPTHPPTPEPVARPTHPPTPRPVPRPTRRPTPRPIPRPDPTPRPVKPRTAPPVCPEVGYYNCPDGSRAKWDFKTCQHKCPDHTQTGMYCSDEHKICPDGSYVQRDRNNDCKFRPCPKPGGGDNRPPPPPKDDKKPPPPKDDKKPPPPKDDKKPPPPKKE